MKPTFIEPQLAHEAADRGVKLGERDFIAEPKIDGYRGQIHIAGSRTAAVFTRRGNNVTSRAGLAWLRSIEWPAEDAILDVELCAGGGTRMDAPRVAHELARGRVNLVIFDLLSLETISLCRARSWRYRRDLLESTFKKFPLIPYTTDHEKLWQEWVVKRNGEGIVLKRTDSLYIPGQRSPAWLKVKFETTVDVVITGISDRRPGGLRYKSGEAALTYGFWDPARGEAISTGQGLIVGSKSELAKHVGRVCEIVTFGITADGSFKSGRIIRWREDKTREECVRPCSTK